MNAIDRLKFALAAENRDDSTFDQYAFWLRKIYGFLKIPASQWTGDDVTRAMVWLNESRYSATSRRQALCAVVFFFRHVLKRDLGQLTLPPMPKQRRTLKIVPTREEVARILSLMRGEFQLMAGLMYGGGTRVEETCMLRVQDLDFERCEIRIEQGKGDKSRKPPLPVVMIPALRAYVEGARRDLHHRDVAAGRGFVELPGRLDRKYPGASQEYRWQFLFASRRVTPDGKRALVATNLRSLSCQTRLPDPAAAGPWQAAHLARQRRDDAEAAIGHRSADAFLRIRELQYSPRRTRAGGALDRRL